MFVHLLL
jgi:hypothetical protein